ncbi:LytTR family DNA-binding domain-containing protein [Alteriqipengyuania sp. 357]
MPRITATSNSSSIAPIRGHRSHAVRSERVERTSRNQWSSPLLHLGDGSLVPVGRKYLDMVKKLEGGSLGD